MESNSTFIDSENIETPIPLLYCYYVLAQHYNFIKKYDEAVKYIEKVKLLKSYMIFF